MGATMSTESQADMSGRKLTREERKALRIADLRQLNYTALVDLRAEAAKTVEYLHATHAKQLANGMAVTPETLRKNCAPHTLTIECIDEILNAADANLQRMAFGSDYR